jgi:hypothetical protein
VQAIEQQKILTLPIKKLLRIGDDSMHQRLLEE